MRRILQRLSSLLSATVAVFRDAYEAWRTDRTLRLGAGLAYYALFGVVPLFTAAVGIASIVFSETDIKSFITEQLNSILPAELSDVTERVGDAIGSQSVATEATTLGLVTGIIAASFFFTALQDALNVIWAIPVELGLKYSIRRRFVAFVVVLLTGALLIAGLIINALLLIVDSLLSSDHTGLASLEGLVSSAAYWALGVAALAGLWQVLVRKDLSWRALIVTSATTVLAMVIGTWVLAAYFEYFGSTSLTGVAAAIFVLLFWLYVEAQILLGGAQLLKTIDIRLHPDHAPAQPFDG